MLCGRDEVEEGIYICFEGGSAAGKTTQRDLLIEWLRQEFPGREIVFTREPGGTEAAEEIRRIVQEMDYREGGEPDIIAEAYLYAASRADSLRKVVKPALERGAIVIADRSFLSSLTYQGCGRELGMDVVWEINKEAVGGVFPDKVILFDLDPEIAEKRKESKTDLDRLDRQTLAFHKRVREGYLQLAGENPERFILVDASLSREAQAEIIRDEIRLLVSGKVEINREIGAEFHISGEREW